MSANDQILSMCMMVYGITKALEVNLDIERLRPIILSNLAFDFIFQFDS